ncbi:F-box domain-containing protein [Mycena kentingensis (nom. inval.)]|nr:F-box domain-containing protein [Mycena kentingensis (nom. inval.)]
MDYLNAVSLELWLRFWSAADAPTLKVLSLVCKRFHALFQPLVFQHLFVATPETAYDVDTEILAQKDALIARFSNIADDPALAALVKTARFDERLQMGRPSARKAMRAVKTEVPAAFFEKLLKLQNLHTLTLWEADPDFDRENPVREVTKELPMLRHLHLHGIILEQGDTLPLESFTFANNSRAFVLRRDDPLDIVDPTTIQRLVLRGNRELHHILVALRGQPLSFLRHLELDISDEVPEAEAVALLEQCPELKSLVLYRHPVGGSEEEYLRITGAGVQQQFMARTLNAWMPSPAASGMGARNAMLRLMASGDQDAIAAALASNRPLPGQEISITIPEGCLPALRTLHCPFSYAASIVPGRTTLRALTLIRDPASTEPRDSTQDATDTFSAFARAPPSGLTRLSLFAPLLLEELPQILETMSTGVPHLRHLAIALHAPDGLGHAGLHNLLAAGRWTAPVLPPSVETLEIVYARARRGGLSADDGDLKDVALAIARAVAGSQTTGVLKRVAFSLDGEEVDLGKGESGEWAVVA